MDSPEIVHATAKNRFEIRLGRTVIGQTEYRAQDGNRVFTHTEVDPELGERGLGSQLIRGALDDVRTSTEAKVVATCPFVRRFLRLHPDYQDLTRR